MLLFNLQLLKQKNTEFNMNKNCLQKYLEKSRGGLRLVTDIDKKSEF